MHVSLLVLIMPMSCSSATVKILRLIEAIALWLDGHYSPKYMYKWHMAFSSETTCQTGKSGISSQRAYLNGTLHAEICVFRVGDVSLCLWVGRWEREEGVGIVPFHLSAYLGFTVPIPGLKHVPTEGHRRF